MIRSAARVVTAALVVAVLQVAVCGPLMAQIDLQGHRGARGLLPENTIPSILAALDHGVDTIELDVVISADEEVVVSHEPWMSSAICRTPQGADVTAANEHALNIYEMTYDEVAAFDCGGRGHAGFPQQRPTAAAKPLLRHVLRVADGYAHRTGRPLPQYNVEIKSNPDTDGRYHPDPETFAHLVHEVLATEDVVARSYVQSFDPRSLQAMREIDPSVQLALLVSNELGYAGNLDRLGFVPEIYSPNQRLADAALVESAHADGVLVIPWTVNDREAMEDLLRLGVDGIITDYPDLGRDVVDAFADNMHMERR